LGASKKHLDHLPALISAAANPPVAATFSTKVLAFDMINHLAAAEADHSLLKKLHHYASPQLLLIDELDYLPLGTQGSNLFFQVIT
jgi:DNA replication protein DnaC